jgi:hypothetical protein
MEIRDPTGQDASAACEVLRRSISELYESDHRNDQKILDRWLANKTPEIVAPWIANPDASVMVAAESNNILAVGSVANSGEITLYYVSPDARFRDISRAMLRSLEVRAVERGNPTCSAASLLPKGVGIMNTSLSSSEIVVQ